MSIQSVVVVRPADQYLRGCGFRFCQGLNSQTFSLSRAQNILKISSFTSYIFLLNFRITTNSSLMDSVLNSRLSNSLHPGV